MARLFSVIALLVASTLGHSTQSDAAITFTIDSVEFFSHGASPTTGTVDVYLDVTGTDVGQQVGNWQAVVNATNFTGSITSVTLGSVGEPAGHTDLFLSSGVDDLSIGGNVIGSSATFDKSNPALFNNAGLMSFDFSVPTGQAGTFDLVFSTTAPYRTYINAPGGANLNPSLSNGTITVSAVPEPSSLAVLGVLGVAGLARRRRSQRRQRLAGC